MFSAGECCTRTTTSYIFITWYMKASAVYVTKTPSVNKIYINYRFQSADVSRYKYRRSSHINGQTWINPLVICQLQVNSCLITFLLNEDFFLLFLLQETIPQEQFFFETCKLVFSLLQDALETICAVQRSTVIAQFFIARVRLECAFVYRDSFRVTIWHNVCNVSTQH